MKKSWMKLTAAALLLACGCAEQPVRSAPGFSRDETGAPIENRETDAPESFAVAETGESAFSDLTEPEVGEPASSEPAASEPASSEPPADEFSVSDAEEMVPDPPQLVLPSHTEPPSAPRKNTRARLRPFHREMRLFLVRIFCPAAGPRMPQRSGVQGWRKNDMGFHQNACTLRRIGSPNGQQPRHRIPICISAVTVDHLSTAPAK